MATRVYNWACTICEATGQADSALIARTAYLDHYLRNHQQIDF